jgi:acyl carrier protein
MSSVEPPAVFARFPAGIREAHRRFREHRDRPAAALVVLAALRHYQAGARGGAPVADTDRLVEDLGYDSLAVAELVFLLEDLFSVTVANSEISELRTVRQVRLFIDRKLASPPATS